MKEVKQFIFAIVIVVVSLTSIDFLIGEILDYAMTKLPNFSEQYSKDNYRLHRMNEEIVIIGSSRGACHYVTSILSDSIDTFAKKHLSIYNASIEGRFLNSNCCAAEVIAKRYSPKLVIFDISEYQLREDDVNSLEFSSPFYWTDPVVKKYIDETGWKARIAMKSNIVRYNGKVLKLIDEYLHPKSYDDGYLPLTGTFQDTLGTTEIKQNQLVNNSVNNLRNVITLYKTRNIPLIIASSPLYRPSDNNDFLYRLCSENGIPFIDCYNMEEFNSHPEYFKNRTHLNDEGARLFSEELFGRIKPLLPVF